MSHSLVSLGTGGSNLPARVERQVAREVALAHARGSVMAAREVAKIEAITEITEEALFSGSEVAAVTNMLVQKTPYAQDELSYIAHAGITAMADVVLRTGRSLK